MSFSDNKVLVTNKCHSCIVTYYAFISLIWEIHSVPGAWDSEMDEAHTVPDLKTNFNREVSH